MDRTKGFQFGLAMRAIRIVTGLVLLLFVTCHLLNLSLGIVSIEAMDNARPFLSGIWANPVMGPVLVLSLGLHYLLGLWAIYRRPTLRTGAQDVVQLVTGVLVVPMLATHAIAIATMKINATPFGYAQAIQLFWLGLPAIGLLQVMTLSVVWIHGCAGLFTWLRSREDMRHSLAWIYPLAVAVPVLALLGYAEAGRSVLLDAQNAAALAVDNVAPLPMETPPTELRITPQAMQRSISLTILGSLGLGILVFVARAVRMAVTKTQPVHLHSGGAGPLRSHSGMTVLDGLRRNDQPHASLCEGRGRCGTCAVRILASEFPLPDASPMELKTLERIGASEDTRLACQLSPQGGFVRMEPVYPADYSFSDKDTDLPSPQAEAEA